jgi:hypothetical protein
MILYAWPLVGAYIDGFKAAEESFLARSSYAGISLEVYKSSAPNSHVAHINVFDFVPVRDRTSLVSCLPLFPTEERLCLSVPKNGFPRSPKPVPGGI